MTVHAKRGDLLSQLTPFVQSVKYDFLHKICSHCFAGELSPGFTGKLLRCSICKMMRYCDRKCQRQDWKFHKIECKCLLQGIKFKEVCVLMNLPYHTKNTIFSADIRLLIRILIRKKRGETKLKCDEMQLRCFDDLMSHSEEIRKDHSRMKDFDYVCSILDMFTRGVLELPSRDELLEIYGKYAVNNFLVCTESENQSEGRAIYLSSSALDHSCDPDAFRVYHNNVQQIRALRDFTYDKYSDIKIQYTDVLAPSYERQEVLGRYYFTCQCWMCSDPTHLDRLMTSSKCPTEGCPAPILQTAAGEFAACGECGNDMYPENYASMKWKAVAESKAAFKELRSVIDYETCQTALSSARKVLHPSNVYLLRLQDCMFRICVSFCTRDRMEEAMGYGKASLESLKWLPQSELRSCEYNVELGLIEMWFGHFQEALEYFEEVREEWYTMHGKNHKVSLSIENSIHRARCMLR